MYLDFFSSLEEIFIYTEPRSSERYDAVIDFLDCINNDGEVYRPTELEAISNIKYEIARRRTEHIIENPTEFDVRRAGDKVADWLIEEVFDHSGRMWCKRGGRYVLTSNKRQIWIQLYTQGYFWIQMRHIKEAHRKLKVYRNRPRSDTPLLTSADD